eukprot:191936-Rhodomonas_salina.1
MVLSFTPVGGKDNLNKDRPVVPISIISGYSLSRNSHRDTRVPRYEQPAVCVGESVTRCVGRIRRPCTR